MDAFKSTLEEAKYADFILHVVDASNPQWDKQMYIVYDTLGRLGVKDKKIITLFNKWDCSNREEIYRDFRADETLHISAKTKEGLDSLEALLARMLREDKIRIEHLVPDAQAGKIQQIRKYGELLTEEYREDGIWVEAVLRREWSRCL